ncbi:MAG: 3-isopropylmalate dehydratase large subunit [Anaerolineae bacterium]|nr:3-isopropylmalate dehydratase large subunit [Phycisphaerae bacterium]
MSRTLFEKVWDDHVVVPARDGCPAVLYVDLHLTHEVTSPQAFAMLREHGVRVRRPDRTLATMDHSTSTEPRTHSGALPVMDNQAAKQIALLETNCRDFGITLHDMQSPSRGIVHVMSPELGATQPGRTIVCGDSHTSTHGAFGALAFGIGTTEVAHVLATQCLLQHKPKTMAIECEGALQNGVTAKDLILAIIRKIGVSGGTGHVIEYRGKAVRSMSMEQRMTVCNMSIEAGARAGMIAPDETTFAYIKGRPLAPKDEAWETAVDRWRKLPSDDGAVFDARVDIDATALSPMITWGTNPSMSIPIDGDIPIANGDPAQRRALAYMGLEGGRAISGLPIDVVFIGSCTNGRIEDLQQAANVLRGKHVARNVRVFVVPGSQAVKREAEARGLAKVFVDAGAEWRESGCSMCIGMNGDTVAAGQYSVSTSNRNFEGRQGTGARTFLASPLTAAAAAIAGKIIDPRELV